MPYGTFGKRKSVGHILDWRSWDDQRIQRWIEANDVGVGQFVLLPEFACHHKRVQDRATEDRLGLGKGCRIGRRGVVGPLVAEPPEPSKSVTCRFAKYVANSRADYVAHSCI